MREDFENRHMEEAAAVIQTKWRDRMLNKTLQLHVKKLENAAIKLQTAWRGSHTRRGARARVRVCVCVCVCRITLPLVIPSRDVCPAATVDMSSKKRCRCGVDIVCIAVHVNGRSPLCVCVRR